MIKKMKPILVTRFSEKDPKKRIRHKVSQEISRNIETGIQNGQLSHVATTVASSTSVKSKRSSGLLSAIVRRTRIKKIKHMGTTPQTVSCTLKNSTFVPSNTSLETHTEEEVEINVENYDKKILQEPNVLGIVNKDTTNTTDSNHSILSVETTRRQFFRKFCKKKVSSGENRKKKSEQTLAVQTSKEDILGPKMSCKICQSDSCRDVSRMDRNTSSGFIYAPTSFINCRKSTLSATILSALQSVQMLSTHFQESENHLVKILTKYVSNSTFQKELLDALSQHSKLQWEAERRTSALANDMWMRQIEIGKAQEQTLQETLNSLVKQNRQLQLDNETMLHKHEKLAKKLRSSSEVGSKCRCPDCEAHIEYLMKHNDKLQTKLKAYIQQLEVLEKELHLLHLQNAGFEEQLKYSASQIHCLKVTLQRSKMEYSLEVATLQYKIQATQDTIKESLMAGDVLLKDLGDIKTQFSNISFAVEFSKPENPRNYLSEVIHIGRSCIHLLSKELLTLQTQMVIKEKDIETLQETNSKLQENLKKSATELDLLSKKIDESNVAETEKIVSEQKAKILENDLKFVQEKLEKVSKERDEEKSTLLSAIANCETLNDEISEKNKMIEQTKVYINNITAENLALRKQIGGLNSVLSESGAGDVAKELATCQEQILYLQAQYYEILNEKQLHLDEINLLRTENDKIREQQAENYKQLHDQFGNLENMIKDNTSLKQQLETEHQTVLSLQNERKKYLEEKNMLRTIFQHMKSEICRVQKLETAIADISREASKLAMVAEYNKNIGEKLKSEVIEKDQTISHLRSSVEKLNDIQVQNTKEKLSLCYELSELCQMKDKLNSILSLEVRRNTALGDSKKELLESTSTQLRKYEELHKNEKSAMKDLLQNYKTVESHRDDLLKDREFLQKEVTRYKIMYKEQSKKFEVAACLGIEKDKEIEQLIAKNCEERKVIDALGTKVTDEVSKYENNIIKLEKLICQLRKDKDDTEDSIKYLQKNIQKLHNDLDESRANEKEAMNVLNKCLLEKEELEREKRYWEKSCTALDQDKDKLVKEINCLNSLCEKVLSDFEASIKASIEKEELFKHEIKESNEIIIRSSKEIDRLNKVVFLKQRDIDNINLELTQVRRNKEDHEERIDSLEGQLKLSQELLNRAEITSDEFSTMQTDYESAKLQLKELEKETDALQRQLEIVTDQRTLDYDFYKKNMDELLRKNEEVQQVSKREIEELKATLVDTTQNLNNERAAYASLSEMHKDVSTKYLDGIEQIMEEKNVRQEIESKLKSVTSSIEKLLIEKGDLEQQVNILLEGLNEERVRINTLMQEKSSCHKYADDLQKKYDSILENCLSLESQIKSGELKAIQDSDRLKSQFQEQIDRFKAECRENHELIITLKENLGQLQQQITGLEFQKSEMTLRLHETQRKFETEQKLSVQLRNTHKIILACMLKLKDGGNVDPSSLHYLVHMVEKDEDHSETELSEFS